MSDVQRSIQQLKSRECFCGKPKDRGKSFCGKCYRSLPQGMKYALYSHIMGGYGAAYDKAVAWLI